jgi:hypothetical protein
MVEVIEREAVGETIDATVNYILNNGEKLFTQTAGPGATDVRTGGTVDPRRVPIHNARLHAEPFALDREGFRFVRHDTKVADFFDEDEVRRVYLSGDGSAGEGRERGLARGGVRPHAAHRR